MEDILERLKDLHKQATVERSHYYVGKCVTDAIAEIERLRSTKFQGLGLNNWTCPHCRKRSDVGPFNVTMKL